MPVADDDRLYVQEPICVVSVGESEFVLFLCPAWRQVHGDLPELEVLRAVERLVRISLPYLHAYTVRAIGGVCLGLNPGQGCVARDDFAEFPYVTLLRHGAQRMGSCDGYIHVEIPIENRRGNGGASRYSGKGLADLWANGGRVKDFLDTTPH